MEKELAMIRRLKIRRHRAVALALSACALTVTAPTAVATPWENLHPSHAPHAAQAADEQAQSATAARDLRSPDARDADNGITTGAQPTPVGTRTVVTVENSGSQTLAIAFSIGALLLSLLAVAFVGIGRRPRPRWSAP